ncbi:Uma2 family endonuclease [Kovacikia minuta CCNUW1]|uniref:Uma2 family endonuclease n=1 Tax=Kovacikia minuta TaxID=2931930 RepID=UPI001CCE0EEC|nr:Uma2 family endonuclease [Kovacikia minuta]UBF27251.1 Uma2 family endonuclease [Kovacikia minuta CCNUW1]
MVLPTITEDTIDLSPGDELILRFRNWEDYENLLSRRQDKAGLRIRYNAATRELRIMSPLPKHGKNADILADLVKALLRYQRKDWEAYTPITLKRVSKQGIEPDYCFYIQNRERILGKEEIDLEVDPPPDLVIEIDLTSATKPEDYQAIAAPELWIYRRSQLHIYLFDGQQYQESQTSVQFPNLDLKTFIPEYVDRGWQIGSSIALREFEQFLFAINERPF